MFQVIQTHGKEFSLTRPLFNNIKYASGTSDGSGHGYDSSGTGKGSGSGYGNPLKKDTGIGDKFSDCRGTNSGNGTCWGVIDKNQR